MAKTIKDTDYLVISARVKALETGLLTAERMEQILDAKSGEDAGKLLQEWGYPQLDPRRPEAMDAAMPSVFRMVSLSCPYRYPAPAAAPSTPVMLLACVLLCGRLKSAGKKAAP